MASALRAYRSRWPSALFLEVIAMSSDFEERLFGQPYSTLVAKMSGDVRIARALRMIEGGYNCTQLSISAMAGVACMSATDFKRRFSRQAGFPPLQFVARYRVMRAVRLLVESDLSVSEVALEAGFCDLVTLDRKLKKFLGVCPKELRKKTAAA